MAAVTNDSDKLVELVHQIHNRTMEGKIPWEQTSDEEVLIAAFPNFTVQLRESQLAADSQYFGVVYSLAIHDERGKLVREVNPDNMETDNGFPTYQLLHATFQRARRQAMGTDNGTDIAIDNVLRVLQEMEQTHP